VYIGVERPPTPCKLLLILHRSTSSSSQSFSSSLPPSSLPPPLPPLVVKEKPPRVGDERTLGDHWIVVLVRQHSGGAAGGFRRPRRADHKGEPEAEPEDVVAVTGQGEDGLRKAVRGKRGCGRRAGGRRTRPPAGGRKNPLSGAQGGGAAARPPHHLHLQVPADGGRRQRGERRRHSSQRSDRPRCDIAGGRGEAGESPYRRGSAGHGGDNHAGSIRTGGRDGGESLQWLGGRRQSRSAGVPVKTRLVYRARAAAAAARSEEGAGGARALARPPPKADGGAG